MSVPAGDVGREQDRTYMRRALELAARGWGRVAPNPLVGAVVVREGRVVGEGWHAEYGGPHAEVMALRAAGELARGATLYVTLEPCAHHGKTPPCTDAVREAGVARLVYATPDPNPKAAGGASHLQAAGTAVEGGVERAAADELNAAFLHRFTATGEQRPWVALKLALSLDAKVADGERRSAWITGEEARAEVHRLRAGFDAVAVGIGTVLADDPLLTVRGPIAPRVPPVRVVFDRKLRLPLESRLVASISDAPLWVVASEEADAERRGALEALGVRVFTAPDLGAALRALRAEGVNALFAEGGAELASALIDGGVVDRMHLVYAPLLLGPEGVSPFAGLASPPIDEAARWRTLESRRLGADTLITLAP